MTVVFVHGVPEAPAIWDEMFAHMRRDDLVRLSPPGFGAPVPDDLNPRPTVTATGLWPNSNSSTDRSTWLVTTGEPVMRCARPRLGPIW